MDGALTTYSADDALLGGRAPVPPCILPAGNNKTQARDQEGGGQGGN